MEQFIESGFGNSLGFRVALAARAPHLVERVVESRFYKWLEVQWDRAPGVVGDPGSSAWADLYAQYPDRVDAAFDRETVTYGEDTWPVNYLNEGDSLLTSEFDFHHGPEDIWKLQNYRFIKTTDGCFLTLLRTPKNLFTQLYELRPEPELFATVASTQLEQVFELLRYGVRPEVAFACAGHTEQKAVRDTSERSLRVKILSELGLDAAVIAAVADDDINPVVLSDLIKQGVPLEYVKASASVV